jgi:predicted secreted protein
MKPLIDDRGARHAGLAKHLSGVARLRRNACVAALTLGAFMPTLHAAEVRENQVSFAATATVEVPLDTLSVTLQAQREGADAASVQNQLKQVLDQSLAEARRQALPDAMEVSTGSFHLNPRYGRDGKPSGWSGSAELLLQGRDVARVAATAGKLGGMAIVATGYSLSRQLREKEESALAAQAIQKFRSRASEVARLFGFNGYTLGEVNVQTLDTDGGGRPPMLAMRAMAKPMADGAPLPTEGGKGSMSVTVQGSITLTR